MDIKKMILFVSGFWHKKPQGDAFTNGDIHIRIAQGKTAEYPVEITSFHGNMVAKGVKAKTLQLNRQQVQELIVSFQGALNQTL